jgi:hypothetical protein
VREAMNINLHPKSDDDLKNKFWINVSKCCELSGNKDIKGRWIPRELIRVDYMNSYLQTQDDVIESGWEGWMKLLLTKLERQCMVPLMFLLPI